MPLEDQFGALAVPHDEGKINYVGLSNVEVEHLEVARRIVPIASVQIDQDEIDAFGSI